MPFSSYLAGAGAPAARQAAPGAPDCSVPADPAASHSLSAPAGGSWPLQLIPLRSGDLAACLPLQDARGVVLCPLFGEEKRVPARSRTPEACLLRPGTRFHPGYGSTSGLFSVTCARPDLPRQGTWSGEGRRKMPVAGCLRVQIQSSSRSKHPRGLSEADGEAGVRDRCGTGVRG